MLELFRQSWGIMVPMLDPTPNLTAQDRNVLAELAQMRRELTHTIAEPRKWTGLLRRSLTAAAIAGSNSIEGIIVNQSDAEAAVAGEEPVDTDTETWNDVLGYRDALTWGQQMADAREFSWHPMMLNGLHYIMQKHRPDVSPGRFRAGDISVTDTSTGVTVY